MKRNFVEFSNNAQSSAFSFTSEQQRILSAAVTPEDASQIMRITAGAGTGKTTTLIHYAKALIAKGHQSVVYLTYSKAGAEEAQERFAGVPIRVSTLHSQAFQCVSADTGGPLLTDDSALNKRITKICQDSIDRFLCRMPTSSAAQRQTKKKVENRVAGFIQKTLTQFLHSNIALEDFKETDYRCVYYPSKRYHENADQATPEHVPRYGYKSFYVNEAKRLYQLMAETSPDAISVDHFRTFDSVMKQAQLMEARIPCSALLIDESQDMNGCQVAWMTHQYKAYDTHLVLVGDPAQSIYGFRGAKSHLLMDIPNCRDFGLTVSHRFGPDIACVANSILYCKENSPQTIGQNSPRWRPYRLVGSGGECLVSSTPLLFGAPPERAAGGRVNVKNEDDSRINCDQFTVLASSNLELFEYALNSVLMQGIRNPESMKKVAINSKGSESGSNLWSAVGKLIKDFFQVYIEEASSLPFYPFEGEKNLTWDIVKRDVETADPPNTKHIQVVSLISRWEQDTLGAFSLFEEHVLHKKYSVTDPSVDIVLSTIHAAKGMEWDHVQVLGEGLATLSIYRLSLPSSSSSNHASSPGGQTLSQSPVKPDTPIKVKMETATAMIHESRELLNAIIDWKSYGDDYNLWYVALTRARKSLSVPEKYVKLVVDMLKMSSSVRSGISISGNSPDTTHFQRSIFLTCITNAFGKISQHSSATSDGSDSSNSSGSTLCTDRVEIGGNARSPREVASLYHHVGRPWMAERVAEGGLRLDGVLCSEILGGSNVRDSISAEEDVYV